MIPRGRRGFRPAAPAVIVNRTIWVYHQPISTP